MPQFESEPTLTNYVLRVAKPAAVSPENGEDEMFRDVETVKPFLLREYQDLIAANGHMPLLCTDGSDCTLLRTKETVRVSAGELPAAFQQRLPGEWLIQRLFLRDGEGKLTVLFDEPRRMPTKTAWAHYSAYAELAPSPRELGHRGVAHYPHVLRQGSAGAITSTHRPTQLFVQ